MTEFFLKNYFITVAYRRGAFHCILNLMTNIYDWYWLFTGPEKYCIKMAAKV